MYKENQNGTKLSMSSSKINIFLIYENIPYDDVVKLWKKKSNLWTQNLTLYETTENQSRPICYLWDETIAVIN